MSRYLVGIDLGTTNSALAYIDTNQKPRNGAVSIRHFRVPQLVGVATVADRPLLPSFHYAPGEFDLPPGALQLPWNPDNAFAVGEFARDHGAKVPGRLVSSAKSWLCHPGVDRTAPLLPWSAPADVPRLSPQEVTVRYLKHFVDSWNFVHGKKEEDRLETQSVVITVPASFDDIARNITMEAAKLAGLQNVRLLEEPQAAFYCWMGMSSPLEIQKVGPGMQCVVVDVGGGTTDFSLIRAGEETGELTFLREAVGDHLLLGGDNMDFALAKETEPKLGGKLDAAQFGMLIQASRKAKEQLLSENPPASVPVTVIGRGRSVIGGTLTAQLKQAEIESTLLDGFFPFVERNAEPMRSTKAGIQEMGLPYVQDPAVTRHLAAFLNRHLKAGSTPDAILFNGGVFTAQPLQIRVIEVMKKWYGEEWQPVTLTTPSLDLAVAYGAAYSAWLHHTGGKRIGGGIPRSYYLGIETGDESKPVLCVIPRRMQEGETIELTEPVLELSLGEPVLFPLYSSTVRGRDKAGQLLNIKPEQLLQLPPVHTQLRGGKRSGVKQVPVTLSARCTEIGTLELYCVGKEKENRWRLEFNVRDAGFTEEGEEEASTNNLPAVVLSEDLVTEGMRRIEDVFAAKDANAKELTKELESALGESRSDWPMPLCRRLWSVLEDKADSRFLSAAHTSRWYNLAGFCLRPGFGDPLDRYRVETLWKILNATSTTKLPEGGADFWIMMRRVAGGLSGPQQSNLWNRLKPILAPAKNKQVPKPPANELVEMYRAAGSLERLDGKTKQYFAEAIFSQIPKSSVKGHLLWALTRIGARHLFYGPINTVVHPDIVSQWCEKMLQWTPETEQDRIHLAFCLAEWARRTGQRAIDLPDDLRERILVKLKELNASPAWLHMVEEVSVVDSQEKSRLFGESLPIGLKLRS